MRKLFVPLLLLGLLICLPAPPASAGVDVNVNIGIPFPGFRVEGPPEMILTPDAPVYFAPGLSVDLFFFDGFWWTRHDGRWFRGPDYRGPWRELPGRRVPPPVYRMRPDYRERWGRGEHIPYGQLKKHWRENRVREDFRHDRGDWGDRERGRDEWRDRDDDRGRDWKEEKRDRKRAEKEWKEDRKGGRGHGRGDD